jgi:LPPG:FO 2-phospho-L-lactate transferase
MLAPSNPVTSIAPILAIPGIRQALNDTHSPVAAVSPIIGRAAVTGPAGALLAAQGFAVSIAGVADFYRDFLDLLVVDSQDAEAARDLNGDVVGIHVTPTIMRTGEDRIALASSVVAAARALPSRQAAAEPV